VDLKFRYGKFSGPESLFEVLTRGSGRALVKVGRGRRRDREQQLQRRSTPTPHEMFVTGPRRDHGWVPQCDRCCRSWRRASRDTPGPPKGVMSWSLTITRRQKSMTRQMKSASAGDRHVQCSELSIRWCHTLRSSASGAPREPRSLVRIESNRLRSSRPVNRGSGSLA